MRKENYVDKRTGLNEYKYAIIKLINKTHLARQKNIKK